MLLDIYINKILFSCRNLSTNAVPWKIEDLKPVHLPPDDQLKIFEWGNKLVDCKYDIIFIPDAIKNIDWLSVSKHLLPHGKVYTILKNKKLRSFIFSQLPQEKNLGLCLGLKCEKVFGDEIHFIFGLDRTFSKPKWNGEKNAVVLVHCGGGFGDDFHTIRHLKKLKKDCSKVIFQSRAETYRLFKNCTFYDDVIMNTKDEEEKIYYDFHVSEMDLLKKYGLSDFSPPYFHLPPKNLLEKNFSINVGFVYEGHYVKYGHKRKFKLENFNIFKNKKINLYCFQKKFKKTIDGFKIFQNEISDWYDTAKYLREMDYVISPDTGFAHLSSLLGKDTRVFLLPCHANYYMPLNYSFSPNYPTKMKLYWGHNALNEIHKDIIFKKIFI